MDATFIVTLGHIDTNGDGTGAPGWGWSVQRNSCCDCCKAAGGTITKWSALRKIRREMRRAAR